MQTELLLFLALGTLLLFGVTKKTNHIYANTESRSQAVAQVTLSRTLQRREAGSHRHHDCGDPIRPGLGGQGGGTDPHQHEAHQTSGTFISELLVYQGRTLPGPSVPFLALIFHVAQL